VIAVTYFTDPGCPWAYCASPALAVLRWRYGEQLDWRLTTIGLTERGEQYERRGYTPASQARGYRGFRRFGMPFATAPKDRVPGTGRACRAIVAARVLDPPREWEVLRALQFAQFTTTDLFDTDQGLRAALARVNELDVDAVLAALHDDRVSAAYEADRAAARSAIGSPTAFQGKAANTDGAVRYTAPSLVFAAGDGRRLEAGGYQPLEAYDVCIANLDPTLERRPPAEDVVDALRSFPYALTTREVAAVIAPHLTEPDDAAAEDQLIAAAAAGRARREPLGQDALWHTA
jgi:2-hydroxychromene-2-carboxylate isomerase